jgi:hypothetical protein
VLLEKIGKEYGPKAGSVRSRPRITRPTARFTRVRASAPRPGRNLGLSRQFAASRAPAWAKCEPGQSEPLNRIRRSALDVRATKTIGPASPTLISFSIPLLPLFSQRRAKGKAAAPAAVHGGPKEERLRRSPAPPCAPSPMHASTRGGRAAVEGLFGDAFEPEASRTVARFLSRTPASKSPAVMVVVEWRARVGHSVPLAFLSTSSHLGLGFRVVFFSDLIRFDSFLSFQSQARSTTIIGV